MSVHAPTPISRLRLFAFLVPASLAAWSGLFYVLRALLPSRDVFAALYRMHTYHEAHAVAFIAVVSVAFGAVAALGGPAVARQSGGRRVAAVLGVLAASVVVASGPGGVLWVVYDVRAGFVPPRAVLVDHLFWGAQNGLALGLLVAVASVPFSVLAAAAGYALLSVGLRLARRREPGESGRAGTPPAPSAVRAPHTSSASMSEPPTTPDTDALTAPDGADDARPGEPEGSGPTGTGTTAGGAMGTSQTGPGAGQTGDDIDPSGADLAYPDMTGVGASSPGTPLVPGIGGDAPDAEIGAPDGPKGM